MVSPVACDKGRGILRVIFSEAHHGTEASRALTLGARTKPPIRPSSEPAPVRCRFDPGELAALLGRTEVLIYKYLQGVHLPRLHDLPELAQALNLKSCRDLIPQEWCNPER